MATKTKKTNGAEAATPTRKNKTSVSGKKFIAACWKHNGNGPAIAKELDLSTNNVYSRVKRYRELDIPLPEFQGDRRLDATDLKAFAEQCKSGNIPATEDKVAGVSVGNESQLNALADLMVKRLEARQAASA